MSLLTPELAARMRKATGIRMIKEMSAGELNDTFTRQFDEIEELKQKLTESERERDEWKGRAEIATYQILFGTDTDKATMNSMREQLTKRDLEQQIQALDDIRCQWLAKASEMPLGLECRSKGASCYNWAMYYAQELAHEIEQLRKGAGDE